VGWDPAIGFAGYECSVDPLEETHVHVVADGYVVRFTTIRHVGVRFLDRVSSMSPEYDLLTS
jgi:hypothetical protein